MSCPSWNELAAHRSDPRLQDGEPAGWREALEHFDRGCPDCRRAALAADPTLVFRRLPRMEMSDAQEAAEVDAVVQAMAALRTASRIEASARRTHAGEWKWKRWTAAAILIGASLSIPADNGWRRLEQSNPAFPLAVQGLVMPSALAAELPTLDEVNLPDARVHHLNGNSVTVAMVYDASFGKLDV